jgi:Ca2+-binding RTX toxin-like protein
MAKIRYSPVAGNDNPFGPFSSDETELFAHGSSFATYKQADTGADIALSGSHFAFSGDELLHATVTEIDLTDALGSLLVSIKGLNLHIKSYAPEEILTVLLEKAFAGDDRVLGSREDDAFLFGGEGNNTIIGFNGDDFIFGGAGNDRCEGDLGSDTFLYTGGNDVITDFDANGGGKHQDHIFLEAKAPFTKTQHGHDTVLDFGHHNTLTLLDVHKADISMADFLFPG